MAFKKKQGVGMDEPAEPAEPAKPKSGKGKAMLLGAGLVLVGAAGQRFLLAGSPVEVIIAPPVQADGGSVTAESKVDCAEFDNDAKGAAPHARRAEGSAAPGGTSDLPSMTINLADGRFLKIGISLELGRDVATDEFKAKQAKAADVVLRFFTTKTVAQLTSDKREVVKSELTCKLQQAYPAVMKDGKASEPMIVGVLFREFLTG